MKDSMREFDDKPGNDHLFYHMGDILDMFFVHYIEVVFKEDHEVRCMTSALIGLSVSDMGFFGIQDDRDGYCNTLLQGHGERQDRVQR
eukprot:3479098-Heterocapsa_arctica.AAC.1